jgi:UDP-N-acetylglucosamine--N-acetylmuramyl-(pentapeptide) pyrophosphoryl-undecaprenol N-acetylglucosamine transferase
MPNVTWVELMPFGSVVDTMVKANSVICHAGVGTIMTALQVGHTPVVVPRQARYGEHVDDHQLDIATRFAERSLVRCVTGNKDLVPLLSPRGRGHDSRIGKGSVELHAALTAAVVATSPRWRTGLPLRRRGDSGL